MSKIIVTITATKAPITIAQLGVVVKEPGITEFEIDKEKVEKFQKTYGKSSYFKRMAESGKMKVIFKELSQEEVNAEFAEIEKIVKEKGKHEDLLGLDLNELKDIYEKEIGSAPGNRKSLTMIKLIIEKREEIEAAGE